MTAADVMRVLLRRWPVVVTGAALTLAAVIMLGSDRSVYSAQTDVVFLAPKSAQAPNPIEATSDSLIATAGLVSRMVSQGAPPPATASSTVSLTGQGIRKGHSVELPDSGGQWVASFDRPALVVQVAGPSEAWVRSTLQDQIGRIENALATMQQKDGISARNTITTSSTPRSAAVDRAGGDPERAAGAGLLLGASLTVLAAIGMDQMLLRRSAGRASRTPPSRTDIT
ncbi:hypothetical protein GEV27_04760 [Aeromicrobium sp. S22]|uniref:hypothetical protein n=1 Tax=Aeromicrobium sp. S22 TaxID=2662029 RepID=UPI00129E0B37|nr:hypothetical protein [Aeromicrobium sp. S22]MRK00826.1 hypothetical protein [Aeromicrobium sp. S22]